MINRLYNIDFLRFLFALTLCVMHLTMGMGSDSNILKDIAVYLAPAQILTDFFFIISGFFLFSNASDITFKEFFMKKINRLWPVLFLSVLCYFTLSFYNTFNFDILEQVSMLLFINSLGFFDFWGYTAWFTSVLFFGFLFYFSLRKSLKNVYAFNTFTTIIMITSYFLLIDVFHGIGGTSNRIYFTSAGMLRAMAGLGVGIILYQVINTISIKEYFKGKFYFFIFGLLEIALLCLTFKLIINYRPNNNLIFILLFIALIILFVYRVVFFSIFLNNKIFSYGGKYSYSLYMMHFPLMYWIASFWWYHNQKFVNQNPLISLILVTLFICLLSICVYYFVEKKSKYRFIFIVCVFLTIIPALIYRFIPLEYNINYKFNRPHPQISLTNVSNIDWAAWTTDKQTVLSFRLDSREKSKLILNLYPYINERHPEQKISAYIDNQKVATWLFKLGNEAPLTVLNLPCRKKQKIVLIMENAISPAELDLGSDSRKLGIAIVSLKVEKE